MFHRRKEMEELSVALEKLINGETVTFSQKTGDTLPSKVRGQLERLSGMIAYREQQMASEKEQIKSLISDIAHQLRTPLANAECYLELLAEICREDQKEYLRAIAESEQKIRFLTEAFIKMSRLESRIIQIKKDSPFLYRTVLGSILQIQKTAEQKQLEVELDMEETIEVWHDPNWLGEALYNLLDNSVKYSPVGGKIRIRAKQDEMYTRILVRDYGTGILAEEENKIFQRFYRGQKADGQPGFGLGLYLAREIVQMHGGFLKATRKQPGLEVAVFLPGKN